MPLSQEESKTGALPESRQFKHLPDGQTEQRREFPTTPPNMVREYGNDGMPIPRPAIFMQKRQGPFRNPAFPRTTAHLTQAA